MTELGQWLTHELTRLGALRLDYARAKEASAQIDAHLGFRQAETEEAIANSHRLSVSERPRQEWIGLPLQAMQTPYSELTEMIATLSPRPHQLWIDLGAAYGRLGLALGALASETRFIGYELVGARVAEGNRILAQLGFTSAQLLAQDLAAPDFRLPEADCYFIYDYGTREDIERTLADLRDVATRRIVTCVARGRGVRHWIERDHPWLGRIAPPQDFGNYSIYRSA